MTNYILFFISLFVLTSTADSLAQFRNTELKGDHTFKAQASAISYEAGFGLSHQYYLTQETGLQTNLDILFPDGEGHYSYRTEHQLSGMGWRLIPEFRYYTRRKARNNMTSFFVGTGPIVKYIQLDESGWQDRFDEVSFTSYQQLNITNYRNIALGLMGRIGVEAYIGRPQRFLFEASFGFGMTQNWVKIEGDPPFTRKDYFLEELLPSDNRSEGLRPYIDVRFGIGYRLFGKEDK